MQTLTPILTAAAILGGPALLAYLASVVAKYISDRRVALHTELLALNAAAAVAEIGARYVNDLKDPSKPGHMDATTGARAKLEAADLARQMSPATVALLERVLGADAVRLLLDGLIERAVSAGKSAATKVITKVTGVSVDGDTAALEAGVVAALDRASRVPAAIKPSGQSGHTTLGPLVAALAVIGLGVALAGCPNWNRPACPRAGVHSCARNWPHYCAPTGELTPIGDEPCEAQGRVCEVLDDGGRARCGRVDAAVSDGGAE